MESHFFGLPRVNRLYGVVVAVVVDNNDPEGLYRVKVKFPWVKESTSKYSDAPDDEDFLSTWARVATFMAGPDRGAFWLPEVDDEVLVAFEHGDIRRPFVIGSLWSPVDKAIHDNKSQNGENNFRTIMSRSGHVIQLIDKEDSEKIVIQTKCKPTTAPEPHRNRPGHFIVLDESDGALKIEISDGKQKNYVTIDSTNDKITVESKEGNILISAPKGQVKIDCKTLVTNSSSSTEVKSGTSTKIQAGSTMDIKSTKGMTIKGYKVNIN